MMLLAGQSNAHTTRCYTQHINRLFSESPTYNWGRLGYYKFG